jgi:radical SAM protein with 4Fe4S-binding SPASM domain
MHFSRIYLEISNICNVQCSFCPEVLRPKKIMNPENFKTIYSEIQNFTDEVCLHVMGEPLAHPQFFEILEVVKNGQGKVNLTTNGLLIKKYQNEILANLNIRQINFSLQAYMDNFPDKPIEPYLDSLVEFIDSAFKLRPDLYINFRLWNQQDSLHVNSENEKIFLYVENKFQVEINRRLDLTFRKSKKILNRLYFHFDTRFDWPSLSLPYQGDSGTCHALQNHMAIMSNGDVIPCCLDKESVINLGNILAKPFVEILNSPRLIQMREGFLKGKLTEKLCQHCTYIRRFDKKLLKPQQNVENVQTVF